MFLRHILSAALVAGLSAASAKSYAALEGYLDSADCDYIRGWAADTGSVNTRLNVDIYDGTTLIARVLSNRLRADVGAYLSSDGYQGFYLAIPRSLRDGANHTIFGKHAVTQTDLTWSPKTLNCAPDSARGTLIDRRTN